MKPLLLTFDVEEFDWPLELGAAIDAERQMQVTAEGLGVLLALLRQHDARATFFVTAEFAAARPRAVRAMADAGHEVGAHGLTHADDYSALEEAEAVAVLSEARRRVEDLAGIAVVGLRTPRLQRCPARLVRSAGYDYDASPHPTWVPGRYNGLRLPRRPWIDDDLVLVPISVLPAVRLPVSWLWYRLAGETLGTSLARAAAADAPYLHLYFHPWEAVSLRPLGIPRLLALRSGPPFLALIDRLLRATRGIHPPSTVAEVARAMRNPPAAAVVAPASPLR